MKNDKVECIWDLVIAELHWTSTNLRSQISDSNTETSYSLEKQSNNMN